MSGREMHSQNYKLTSLTFEKNTFLEHKNILLNNSISRSVMDFNWTRLDRRFCNHCRVKKCHKKSCQERLVQYFQSQVVFPTRFLPLPVNRLFGPPITVKYRQFSTVKTGKNDIIKNHANQHFSNTDRIITF
jgi:hypothetical protein